METSFRDQLSRPVSGISYGDQFHGSVMETSFRDQL